MISVSSSAAASATTSSTVPGVGGAELADEVGDPRPLAGGEVGPGAADAHEVVRGVQERGELVRR